MSIKALDIDELLERARGRRALCVGDVMLDRYVYGETSRISPEAPVPVLRRKHVSEMPGGAANVARNAAALGLAVELAGVIGGDEEGESLARSLAADEGVSIDLVVDRERPTTLKTRFVAGGQQLLRVDQESAALIPKSVEDALIERIRTAIEPAVVILSDYAKGAVTPAVIAAAAARARAAGAPFIVDPKNADLAYYGAVDLLKPNAKELAEAVGSPTVTDLEIEAALKAAAASGRTGAVVVTRGAKGLSFISEGGVVHHVRGRARDVFDVSGAGDTGLAAIAAALAGGGDVHAAATLALAASGLAVERAGAAIVSTADLLNETHRSGRGVRSLSTVEAAVRDWRARGLVIGFTNGCFDLLHPGHVALIEEAKAQCDRLIVALNSDASVRRLKGESRPVSSLEARARVIGGLAAVDAVLAFEEDTPLRLIEALRPDVLVKGGDYRLDEIVGAPEVRSWGGRVHITPTLEGHSTTQLIRNARARDI